MKLFIQGDKIEPFSINKNSQLRMESITFENYKILHLIGEGSFGKVFKAAENGTKTVVALKILKKVCCIIYLFKKNNHEIF